MVNEKDTPGGMRPPIVMTFPKEEEITPEVVQKFIRWHQLEIPRYKNLMYMYKNMTAIFDQKDKDPYKPDNRLSANFSKFIVDTFIGFFNGIPVKKTHQDKSLLEKINDFDNLNDMEDEESELAKMACIYGRCYEYMYQNEDAETYVVYNSPEDMFIVYDDSIKQAPLFAVRYGIDDNQTLRGTLIMHDYLIDLSGSISQVKFGDDDVNPYNGLPVTEFIFNEERMGVFESVISLMNNFNKALSEKSNDVDYFSDQYMAFLGAEIDTEDLKEIRDNRIINYFGGDTTKVDVKFLDKPDSDEQTEHLLDRLQKLIFQTSMVANISDESFGSSSGTALAYKLEAMSNLALSFQRKYQSALNKRYKLFFSLLTNVPGTQSDEWKNIEYTFTRQIPRNLLEEAQTASQLMGVTSEETALSVLSVVPDVQAEVEKIKKEKPKSDTVVAYDFGTNRNGEADAESEDE